jgi:hypothetical protein
MTENEALYLPSALFQQTNIKPTTPRMRNFYILIIGLLFSIPTTLFGQLNHGLSFDNYGGIYGVVANPANSVESKHKLHVNAISYNNWNYADFGAVDLLNVETNPNGFNGLDFSKNISDPTKANNMTSNRDVMLPSILWGFHEKHAVSLILRSRSFADYQNFDGNLWAQLNEPITEITGGVSGESNFNNTVHHWDEVGLNYAFVVFKSNYHFLKFGGTIKYLSGRGGVELSGIDPNNNTDPRPNGSITANETGSSVSEAEFAYLNTFTNELPQPNFTSDQPNAISNAFSLQNKGWGIGGDLGFVYEWRPRETNRVGVRNSSSGVNTYKLRISASVLDLGTVNYEGFEGGDNNINRRTYSVDSPALPISTNNLEEFFDTLGGSNTATPPIQQGSVSFALPRSLNIGLDYIIFNDKNYYINLNYVHPLTNVEDAFSNMRMQLMTLTPRFETRDFSAYVPITYGVVSSSIHAGIGVRYKYITAGCAALSSFVQDKPLNHIYVGLSLPILEEVFQ